MSAGVRRAGAPAARRATCAARDVSLKMDSIMTTEAAGEAAAETAPPPPAPPEPLRPVATSERVDTIDILRGLALFGILAANIRGFAGPALTYFTPHLFWPAFHDRLAQAFIDTFVQGKFITIFAFLFGVGFAVQFERAGERGTKFGWTYSRRLAVLLLFGLVHGLLIWFGDILLVYALDGFLLLMFRKRTDTTLKIWAAIALLLMPLLMTVMFIASQAGAKMPDLPTPKPEVIAREADIYENGSFAELQTQRAGDAVKHNWGFFPFFGWHVLGVFLIGILAWRRRVFHPTPESLPKYRKAMWWGFAIGVTGNVTATVLRWMSDPPPIPTTPVAYAIVVLGTFATPALSLGYICLVILICQRETVRAKLRSFDAIGRTALTNYLLQSIIGTLIFYSYGFRLLGDVGPAVLLPLTFVIFAVQLAASRWWLERFRFGPVEWLWRRLTYGGPLPMRRGPRVVAEEAPALP